MTGNGADAPAPSRLWFVDRSRYEDGQGFCKRARALGYHLGPDGYGIQKKGTRIPLMTGIGAHEGVAPILGWCHDHLTSLEQVQAQLATGQGVPDEVVRTAVTNVQAAYWTTVEARGYAYLQNEPGVKEITTEQNYLIEGMIWSWVIEVLPEVLTRGYVLEVETEGVHIVGCTCGLGDGILGQAEHDERGCTGIAYQNRPDFIIDTWSTRELEYHEFKTTGADMPSFRDKWEVSIQTFSAMLDVERRHERHVQSFYIHGLIKGKREGEYNPATKKRDGIIRQQSPFCYAYRRPANPPMEQEEWQATYEWVDDEGNNRRLGKAFSKAPLWEFPDGPLMGTTIASKCEFWVKWMPSSVRRKQLLMLGPFSRQTAMVDTFLTELQAEEHRWQANLWELYDLYTQLTTRIARAMQIPAEQVTWTLIWIHPDYQAALDRLFPRSYMCRRFGLRHACQYEMLCFYREGWANPIEGGHYIPRRPHHQPELDQAIGRGLILPAEGIAEGEGEE